MPALRILMSSLRKIKINPFLFKKKVTNKKILKGIEPCDPNLGPLLYLPTTANPLNYLSKVQRL